MIIDHVPAVHVPPDNAASRVAAAVPTLSVWRSSAKRSSTAASPTRSTSWPGLMRRTTRRTWTGEGSWYRAHQATSPRRVSLWGHSPRTQVPGRAFRPLRRQARQRRDNHQPPAAHGAGPDMTCFGPLRAGKTRTWIRPAWLLTLAEGSLAAGRVLSAAPMQRGEGVQDGRQVSWPVRAGNLVHGSDQQGCSSGCPAVMITDHVPAVRVPPDYAGRRGIAAIAA